MLQIIFGWPAISLALCAFAIAFMRDRSVLGFVGLAAATPFLSSASTAPGGWWISFIMFVTLGCAAVFLRRGQRGWAALCLSPFVLLVVLGAVTIAGW